MRALAIPDEPEAMTPAWLTAALRVSGVLTEAVVTACRHGGDNSVTATRLTCTRDSRTCRERPGSPFAITGGIR
jgi:hypothetical protein